MEKRLLAVLRFLEDALPVPRDGMHHSITRQEYGSSETGWEDKLALTIWTPDGNQQILFLDDGDLDRPLDELLEEIIKATKGNV